MWIEFANFRRRTAGGSSGISLPGWHWQFGALIACMLSLIITDVAYGESESFEINDAEFSLTRYAGAGDDVVLWITSGSDPQGYYEQSAQQLAKLGVSVVSTDILEAYLLDNSRGAMVAVPPEDLVALYEHVAKSHTGRIVILAAGRVAIPVLRAINLWQIKQPVRSAIAGTILVSPNLYMGVPELGDVGKFYPVAEVSTIPTFIVQPRLSIRAFRLQEVAKQLGKSGSPVYTRVVKDLHGGFFFNAAELEDDPQPMIVELVKTVASSSKLLWRQGEVAEAPKSYQSLVAPEKANLKKGLVVVEPSLKAPPLAKPLLDGTPTRLTDYSGKVVIVNFWASWCPPCLEEIPSMVEFYNDYRKANKNIELLAVSVGETVEEVESFLKDVPLPFPILMDAASESATDWRVFTFPTTLVLDGNGAIAAGSVGVIDWTLPETRQVIDDILTEL